MLKKINTNIDKELIKQRFSAAIDNYDKEAIAQQHIYNTLGRFIDNIEGKEYSKVLEIGAGTGAFTQYIDAKINIKNLFVNDLTDNIIRLNILSNRDKNSITYLIGDAESIDLGDKYDLIVSSSAIQWFHNPISFIEKIYKKLNNNGSLLISSFADKNLIEIKTITGIGLDYYSKDTFEKNIKKIDSRIEVIDEIYVLEFDKPLDVLKHLKATGVTATSGNNFVWTKERLENFDKRYRELFTLPSGKVSLSYHPVYIKLLNK